MIEPIVDISTWQGPINYSKLASAARAVIIRAGSISSGDNKTVYSDYRFTKNANGLRGRIPMSFYWYFRPFRAKEQADLFSRMYNDYDCKLEPVIDVEVPTQTQPLMQKELKLMVDVITDKTGKKPIIYTRATIWNPYVGNPFWAKDLKLWIAYYNRTATHPWEGSVSWLRPITWSDWFMWQYSADGNKRGVEFGVSSSDIDINRCNMTEEQWKRYIGGELISPPAPQPEFPRIMKVNRPIYNYRSIPRVLQNNILGKMLLGTKVKVIEKQGKWYKIQPQQGWMHESGLEETE